MTNDTIIYDHDVFKSIACIPEYSDYPNIYVAKAPHYDDDGLEYQVINTAWNKEKILHPIHASFDKDKYLVIALPRLKGKNQKQAKVHRLVLLTWGNRPDNYRELQCNHRNEIKTDNRFSNLELVTAHDNLVWGTRLQRAAATMARNGKTTKVVAINIKTGEERRFDNTCKCARALGLYPQNVYSCLALRRRSAHGYVFCRQEQYSDALVEVLLARASHRKTKN